VAYSVVLEDVADRLAYAHRAADDMRRTYEETMANLLHNCGPQAVARNDLSETDIRFRY